MAQVGSDRWADQSQRPLEAVKGNHISRFRSSKDVKILKSLCKYPQKVPKYLWWAWLCMLPPLAELGNLGKSHQAQVNHVFNFILEMLRRRKAAFPLKPGARLCPLTLLTLQLLPCPHRHPCVKSMSCPQSWLRTVAQRSQEASKKAISSSRIGFLQGRRQQWSSSHEARGHYLTFTATTCLLFCQHINISHEYSRSKMKWLFLKSRAMFKHYPDKGRAVKPLLFAAGLHGFWKWVRAAPGACLNQAWRIKHLQIVLLFLISVFHNCMSSVQLSPALQTPAEQ